MVGGVLVAVYLGLPPTDRFGRVPIDWMRDPKLSAKAKGVLAYLLSHRSGYPLRMEQIIAEMKDGPAAIYAAVRELEEAGYVTRVRRRAERGTVGEVDLLVVGSDGAFPQVETTSRFPTCGESGSGNDQGEHGVSAGETTSRLSTCGKTTSGKSATKKNNPKKTKVLEDQEEDHSLSARNAELAPATEPQPNRERDQIDQPKNPKAHPRAYPRSVLAEHFNITDETEADQLIDLIEAEHNVRGPGFWITVAKNGTAVALITAALTKALNRDTPSAPVEPCPLPDHRGPIDNCHRCWADRKAGDDPYAGHEHLRPTWWWDVYTLTGRRRTP